MPTQKSKTNGENVQHENASGENGTQSSEHNAQRKESETNGNNSNSNDKEDGVKKRETLKRLMGIVQKTKKLHRKIQPQENLTSVGVV